jgi:hypothetical protein
MAGSFCCSTPAIREPRPRRAQSCNNADLLRILLAQTNVTVLTSSSADKLSREDPSWGHGAFTKVVLEALGRAADTSHNGMISSDELTSYVADNLRALTKGEQDVGIEMRFHNDIFVAGL